MRSGVKRSSGIVYPADDRSSRQAAVFGFRSIRIACGRFDLSDINVLFCLSWIINEVMGGQTVAAAASGVASQLISTDEWFGVAPARTPDVCPSVLGALNVYPN